MEQTQIAQYKQKLELERDRLTDELKSLGRQNPTNPNDWETTYSDLRPGPGADETTAEPDDIDQADLLEEFEERNSTEVTIEARYNNVKNALKRIEDGTYGSCSIGGERHPIEPERLNANPAAETCVAHLEK